MKIRKLNWLVDSVYFYGITPSKVLFKVANRQLS